MFLVHFLDLDILEFGIPIYKKTMNKYNDNMVLILILYIYIFLFR